MPLWLFIIVLFCGSFLSAMESVSSLAIIPFEVVQNHIIAELPVVCDSAQECARALSNISLVNKKLFVLSHDVPYLGNIIKKMINNIILMPNK